MTNAFEGLESNLDEGLAVKPKAASRPSRSKPKAPVIVQPVKKAEPAYQCIILEENENIPPTGLFVQLNGKPYIIKPGEPVEVPRGIISILKDAIMDVPVMGPDQDVIGYRKKMRYPFTHAVMG